MDASSLPDTGVQRKNEPRNGRHLVDRGVAGFPYAVSTEPADAFRKAFGKSMREVLDDLRSYIRGGTFQRVLFDVALAKSAEDPEIKPVAPFESGLVLASVLSDSNTLGAAVTSW